MKDDRSESFLRDLARDYNLPPETPREEIWAQIEEQRRERRDPRRRQLLRSPWLWLPVAAAATLLFGIMIGRDSLRQDAEQAVAEYQRELAAENARTIFQLAAAPTLSRAEVLLTQYRSSQSSGEGKERITTWAKDILVETRLLLDSPATEGDSELHRLLQDLELALVRIRQATVSGQVEDHKLTNEGIEERDLLLRLRARIPAGDTKLAGA